MSDITAINQVLAQMQALKAQSTGIESAAPKAVSSSDFGQALRHALEQVNDLQQTAGNKVDAFERGDPGADLASAMIASQKANLSFRAVTEVRNRFVQAYQDIMNMPI